MVVNPKKYQKAAALGIESAINLIYQATVVLGKKLSKAGIFDYFSEELKGVNNQKISKKLYELKRSGYLGFEGDSVVLTNKAKMKIIDQLTSNASQSKKYHLVSFDIPEAKRINRDQFRRAIKRMGFIQIQKSLWVSRKNVGEFVEMAAEEYKVSDYVAYFVSEKSNIDRYIENIFLDKHI